MNKKGYFLYKNGYMLCVQLDIIFIHVFPTGVKGYF